MLYRKQANRATVTEGDLAALVQHLQQARGSPRTAAECASVISNLCHEHANVRALLRCGAVTPLAALLGSTHADVQTAAAGAIQSICSQASCAHHLLTHSDMIFKTLNFMHGEA